MLEVSAIGIVYWVWIGLEPVKRICETGKTEKLSNMIRNQSSPLLKS